MSVLRKENRFISSLNWLGLLTCLLCINCKHNKLLKLKIIEKMYTGLFVIFPKHATFMYFIYLYKRMSKLLHKPTCIDVRGKYS